MQSLVEAGGIEPPSDTHSLQRLQSMALLGAVTLLLPWGRTAFYPLPWHPFGVLFHGAGFFLRRGSLRSVGPGYEFRTLSILEGDFRQDTWVHTSAS